MAKTSPTQRSLKFLRDAGWTVDITEKWNAYTRTRKDLFGCIDLVAIRYGELAGIQTTSGPGSSRIAKIKAEPRMVTWLEAGGTLYVHGWREIVARKKDGTKAKRKRWDCRVVKLTLDDLRRDDEVGDGALVAGVVAVDRERVGGDDVAQEAG